MDATRQSDGPLRFQVLAIVECVHPTTTRLRKGARYFIVGISKTGKLKLEPITGRPVKGWFGRKAFVVRIPAARVKRFPAAFR